MSDDPTPVGEQVARFMPQLERLRERAKQRNVEVLFDCHVCRDQGWVEVSSEGRGTWTRCDGHLDRGCGYERKRAERRARERGQRDQETPARYEAS